MSRLSTADKILKKRETLVQRTGLALAIEPGEARHLLSIIRHQSVRLNPLEANPESTLKTMSDLGWRGQPYQWMSHGYSVHDGLEALRDSQLAASGAIYIQNAASWVPVLALGSEPGEHILDVCAAPGGKTSHIAALTNNQAIITANDNSRPRLLKLRTTLHRLNAHVEAFTLFDAQQLSRKLEGTTYDRILIDAPCSGEGLMRLDNDKDFTSWSVAHIKRLNGLQKRIIAQSWRLLKPGGTLVYSTCTMAPEENEAVIDYALRSMEEVAIAPIDIDLPNRVQPVREWNGRCFSPAVNDCLRLKPSQDIEAFFVAKLIKVSD